MWGNVEGDLQDLLDGVIPQELIKIADCGVLSHTELESAEVKPGNWYFLVLYRQPTSGTLKSANC